MTFAPLKSDQVTLLAMHTNTLNAFSIPQSRDHETWAMAHHKMGAEIATRVFEAHDAEYVRHKSDRTYLRCWEDRLSQIANEKPLYTLHEWPKLGTHHFNVKLGGRRFIESSIGYMLAMAVWATKNAGPIRRVSMYGLSLNDHEDYGYQKPNAMFYLGQLEAMGVELVIPKGCEAFKSKWPSKIYGIGADIPPEKRAKI
jgi:hypothetical protein